MMILIFGADPVPIKPDPSQAYHLDEYLPSLVPGVPKKGPHKIRKVHQICVKNAWLSVYKMCYIS